MLTGSAHAEEIAAQELEEAGSMPVELKAAEQPWDAGSATEPEERLHVPVAEAGVESPQDSAEALLGADLLKPAMLVAGQLHGCEVARAQGPMGGPDSSVGTE